MGENPETLTILGNGRQEKSYLHIDDYLDTILHVFKHADGPLATDTLGTRTTTAVNRIADIISDELGCEPKYEYTGGDQDWTGDVPKMRLSIEKLDALGWLPNYESDAAVRKVTRELIAGLEVAAAVSP